MNPIVAIAILGACICGWTSAIDFDVTCNAKIQQFRDCHVKIRQGREAEAKTRDSAIQQCYTTSGCTPPVQGAGNDASRQQREQCMKDVMGALKAEIKTCVQGKLPGLQIPDDAGKGPEGGHRGGFGKHDPAKACGSNSAAAATLKTCIQNAHSGAQSGPDQEHTRFDANCKAKADCDAILGAQCQDDMQNVETALCQCGQQLRTGDTLANAKKNTPSCSGLTEGQHQGGPPKGAQGSCDARKDYCKLGYDTWKADRAARQQQHGGGSGAGK